MTFAGAHAAGAEYIETDCRLTADGDVVLFHAETLTRLSGDHGDLLTLKETLEAFPPCASTWT